MKNLNYLVLVLGTSLLISCGENAQNNMERAEDTAMVAQTPVENPDRALTEAERNALQPADVVAEFKAGNQRFIMDSLTLRDRKERISQTGGAQYPKAMILSCIDSRVPVEEIFDQGLGDIFVGRIAGNFADEEMLGSMEFATKVAGSKVIVVLGHESCGAVKSAIDKVELGNITALLEHIKPAIKMTDGFPEDKQTIKNDEYVDAVIHNNVIHTLDKIRNSSAIVSEMEKNGEIKLVGAVYNVTTGAVDFIEEPGTVQ